LKLSVISEIGVPSFPLLGVFGALEAPLSGAATWIRAGMAGLLKESSLQDLERQEQASSEELGAFTGLMPFAVWASAQAKAESLLY
jgi:hypothetical protein